MTTNTTAAASNENRNLEDILESILSRADRNDMNQIEVALEQGYDLSVARRLLKSDNAFGDWMKKHVISDRLTTRTAYNYRMLFDLFGHLPASHIERIGLSNCYRLFSASKEAQDEVVEIARDPKSRLRASMVRDVIDQFDGAAKAKAKAKKEREKAKAAAEAEAEAAADLRDKGVTLLELIGRAGKDGISRDQIVIAGEGSGITAKHIDGALAPLFIRGLIYAPRPNQIVATRHGWPSGATNKAGGVPPLTKAEYKLLLICLHPDQSPSQEQKTEAMKVMNAKKSQLAA